jgi:hypothetical protein
MATASATSTDADATTALLPSSVRNPCPPSVTGRRTSWYVAHVRLPKSGSSESGRSSRSSIGRTDSITM